ncbi:P-loop NTPase family protein [Sphingobacterium cavernae]|uniref:hypothetical protein n=1 Tax=Sphingobacterium cavernae TaxID=2592657 RepID=UPI0012302136|nr:hypothetical protein [Sphingobacterium cavernae]
MKALGIVQFHQKKFKLMDLEGSDFQPTLGNIPLHFICVIGGYSGNGKTEFCVKLAKELVKYNLSSKAAWFSYEQRHGFDLQTATKRNKMEEVSGRFIPIDPIANLPKGVTFLEDLDNYLSKRNSPDYVFIDSVDYTGWKKEDYIYLKEKYEGKKTLIFICHTDRSGNPRKSIAADIIFDGGMFILVQKYIATPQKNRFGGFEPYVIWEQKARELNPLFFDPKNKASAKSSSKQPELFGNLEDESTGVIKNPISESKGVDAKCGLKVVG